MSARKLSLREKKQLEKCISNVQRLSAKKYLGETDRFIKRQQIRLVLLLLGAIKSDITIRLRAETLDIINDWQPFKILRIRKLIENGRRRQ